MPIPSPLFHHSRKTMIHEGIRERKIKTTQSKRNKRNGENQQCHLRKKLERRDRLLSTLGRCAVDAVLKSALIAGD